MATTRETRVNKNHQKDIDEALFEYMDTDSPGPDDGDVSSHESDKLPKDFSVSETPGVSGFTVHPTY